MDKYGYIYITTNLINNKRYIGQHKSDKFDPDYKGSGIYLKNAFNKYGWNNFIVELLEWCYSREELDNKEVHYIKLYDAANSKEFYNESIGGQSWNGINSTKSIIQKRNRIKSNKYGNPMGQCHSKLAIEKSKITRTKIYGNIMGACHTPDARKLNLMSMSLKFEYDNKIFVGYENLIDYIRKTIYPTISRASVQRLVNGSYVKKYNKLYGKIKLLGRNITI